MERRDYCLFEMYDQGKITEKQYKKALKEKIKVQDYSTETEEDTTEEETSAEEDSTEDTSAEESDEETE